MASLYAVAWASSGEQHPCCAWSAVYYGTEQQGLMIMLGIFIVAAVLVVASKGLDAAMLTVYLHEDSAIRHSNFPCEPAACNLRQPAFCRGRTQKRRDTAEAT